MYVFIILVVVFYFLAVMPRICKRPNAALIMGWHYAHRGLHNNYSKAPENSLAAFRLAVEKGYGIELDVQLTKDNQVVVFHDFNLVRVCGVNKKVCQLTYQEFKEYHLFRSQETIPLLQDVLRLVNGQVPLIVELKCKNGKDRIAFQANEILSQYKGVYCIESFHPLALFWYRKNQPDVIRGQLADIYRNPRHVGEAVVGFMQSHLLFNFAAKPDFIAYNHWYQGELSRNICRYVYHTISVAWTVRSEKEYKKCKDSFDLFIFERFSMK